MTCIILAIDLLVICGFFALFVFIYKKFNTKKLTLAERMNEKQNRDVFTNDSFKAEEYVPPAMPLEEDDSGENYIKFDNNNKLLAKKIEENKNKN